MKKRNLIILLLMPFIIALFSLTAINLTFNLLENDIIAIEWNYNDVEGFKVDDEEYYLLEAQAIDDRNYPSKGNILKWSVKNKDSEDLNQYAEILSISGRYYLKAIAEGEVIITCSNGKGNISRSMTGVIYENGLVLANPLISGSQSNVSSTIYYGEYDLDGQNKVTAKVEYQVSMVPSSIIPEIIDYSNETIKYKFDSASKILTIEIIKEGLAYLTLNGGYGIKEYTISFEVVDNGVNVYSYDDLLNCTNKSESGEIVVLRKSFESLANTYKFNSEDELIISNNSPLIKANNIDLFGKYDHQNKSYSFGNEIYRFETTYNKKYIDQWNEFASKSNGTYKSITSTVNVGLHVQKDFYGNGYTLNFHNLTYPYSQSEVESDGEKYIIPKLREDNLFRGPLPFYTLGDPNGTPLVGAYGQDNIGFYVEGNNITINDVNIKNCDFGNNFTNLDYTGTVVEVSGNSISLINSRFSNGKNVLRSFSSSNILIDNCLLSYARNFLITTGSNEFIEVKDNKVSDFVLEDGSSTSLTTSDYLANKGLADTTLSNFLDGTFDKESMKTTLLSLQKGLDDGSVDGNFHGDMTINDSYFYRSGVASIALESAFNGPYLYSNIPSSIGELFKAFSDTTSLVPYEANKVSGTSYPVKVKLTGKTTFFDYKDISTMDLSGLISENISAIANSIGQNVRPITIDDIFPLRSMLSEIAKDSLVGSNINIPIAYYGGGLNYSQVEVEGLDTNFTSTVEVNLLDSYLDLPSTTNFLTSMKYMMQKCVTVVTGFHPFKFSLIKGTQQDVDATPSIEMLKENAKGVN